MMMPLSVIETLLVLDWCPAVLGLWLAFVDNWRWLDESRPVVEMKGWFKSQSHPIRLCETIEKHTSSCLVFIGSNVTFFSTRSDCSSCICISGNGETNHISRCWWGGDSTGLYVVCSLSYTHLRRRSKCHSLLHCHHCHSSLELQCHPRLIKQMSEQKYNLLKYWQCHTHDVSRNQHSTSTVVVTSDQVIETIRRPEFTVFRSYVWVISAVDKKSWID